MSSNEKHLKSNNYQGWNPSYFEVEKKETNMKLTKEKFKEGLYIENSCHGWYIVLESFSNSNNSASQYLHKDGTIHNHCGTANFFKTFKEAANFLIELEKNLEPEVYEVKLNEKYIAIVSKEFIKVEHETFPVSILKELQDAHNKLNVSF